MAMPTVEFRKPEPKPPSASQRARGWFAALPENGRLVVACTVTAFVTAMACSVAFALLFWAAMVPAGGAAEPVEITVTGGAAPVPSVTIPPAAAPVEDETKSVEATEASPSGEETERAGAAYDEVGEP